MDYLSHPATFSCLRERIQCGRSMVNGLGAQGRPRAYTYTWVRQRSSDYGACGALCINSTEEDGTCINVFEIVIDIKRW